MVMRHMTGHIPLTGNGVTFLSLVLLPFLRTGTKGVSRIATKLGEVLYVTDKQSLIYDRLSTITILINEKASRSQDNICKVGNINGLTTGHS